MRGLRDNKWRPAGNALFSLWHEHHAISWRQPSNELFCWFLAAQATEQVVHVLFAIGQLWQHKPRNAVSTVDQAMRKKSGSKKKPGGVHQ